MAAPSPVELCDGVGSVGEWHVDRHVSLHFRVPYMTVWGQSLVVSGDGRALGDWDPLAGARMSCKHVGEELVWEAHVSVPFVDSLRYRCGPATTLAPTCRCLQHRREREREREPHYTRCRSLTANPRTEKSVSRCYCCIRTYWNHALGS